MCQERRLPDRAPSASRGVMLQCCNSAKIRAFLVKFQPLHLRHGANVALVGRYDGATWRFRCVASDLAMTSSVAGLKFVMKL